jgi:serine/threonine protein kinase
MTARDALRKGDWLGDYEIRDRMRAGGMATLFLAQRHGAAGVSRPVVIKVIHPHLAEDEQIVRMFIDEARISSHIRHSNVVYIEKFGEHDGLYYMVMEHVDGCSLLQVIRACAAEGRKLSAAIAVHIAIEVAAGLHAAHETAGEDGAPLGIVHRDVSPSNVLLTRDGRVKVIDFGIAKAHGRLGATRSGSGIKGKLCYMSPEQAWGTAIDRRIDIYAAGICLWELLTTRQLFRGPSDLAVLELVRNPVIPLASTLHPEVSAALDEVMSRATARRPEDRHQTALELRRDLMTAVPGAVAVPPEMIAELVRHVCERERRTAERGSPKPELTAASLLPVPEASVRTAAGEIQSRAWRNRGLMFVTFIGACALGVLFATAITSSDTASSSTPPPQAVEAPPHAVQAPEQPVQTPAAAVQTPDAALVALPAAPEPGAAPPREPIRAQPANAPATSPAPAETAPAASAASTASSAPTTGARPTEPATSTATRSPPRRTPPAAPRADKGRVTAIEVDGAVLADEPAQPVKSAAKPTPKPDNAVRVDDAVLAK